MRVNGFNHTRIPNRKIITLVNNGITRGSHFPAFHATSRPMTAVQEAQSRKLPSCPAQVAAYFHGASRSGEEY